MKTAYSDFLKQLLQSQTADKSNTYMDRFLPDDFFQKIAKDKNPCVLYPKYSDRDAWMRIRHNLCREKMLKDILISAEYCISVPPTELPFELFQEYAVNGNRLNFQSKYFERRSHLTKLILGMCLTGQTDRWMPAILQYTNAILDEFMWCIPAHCIWDGTIPLPELSQADLFANETGNLLALEYHIIGQELEQEKPGISDTLKEVVWERTIGKILDKNISRNNWWFYSLKPANWTIWCSANCLTIACCIEDDKEKLAEIVRLFLYPISRYIAEFPDDGYCDEGPGYYYKSGYCLGLAAARLNKLYPGSMDAFYAEPKHRKIMEYIADLEIGGDFLRLSDARTTLKDTDKAVLIPSASQWQSEKLKNFCFLDEYPSFCPPNKPNANLDLTNILEMLFDAPECFHACPNTEISPVSAYQDKVAIVRTKGFSVSLKGGTNGENHNHNDLGHFTVFFENTPIVTDAGTDAYNKINFSSERFTLWYTRGNGHNAPVFGDIEQLNGTEYHAELPLPEKTEDGYRLTCDLTQAYPKQAGIIEFSRFMDVCDTKVIVEDSIQMEEKYPVTISLLTKKEPVVLDPNHITIENVNLKLENISFQKIGKDLFSASQENEIFFRIVLYSDNVNYRMIFEKNLTK